MPYRKFNDSRGKHTVSHQMQVITRLIFSSIGVWVGMSLLGFIFLTDLRITDHFQLNAFANFAMARSTLANILILLGLSVIVGAIAALPAVLIFFGLIPRIDAMQRKLGKSKKIQLFFLQSLPVTILALTEFILLSLSLGTAPQVPRSWTRNSNLISDWSMFIYELFYYPLNNSHIAERWQETFSSKNGIHSLTVYLPETLLSQPENFPKLKKVLGNSQPFFITAATFPSLLAQVNFGQSAGEPKFLAPLLGAGQSLSVKNAENFSFSLRSEWHSIENEFSHKIGKSGFQWDKHEALRMRLAQSQYHLFMFFRLGLMSFFHDNWKWKNIAADDASILDGFSEKILKKKSENTENQIIQLGETVAYKNAARNPFSPVDWPEQTTELEKQWLATKLDRALNLALASTKDRKDLSVFVLPFLEKPIQNPFSRAFIKPNETDSGSLLGAQGGKLSWIIPQDIFSKKEKLKCLPLLMNTDFGVDPNPSKSSLLQKSIWEIIRENSIDRFVFPEKFSFLTASDLKQLVFCRNFNKDKKLFLFSVSQDSFNAKKSDEQSVSDSLAQNLLKVVTDEKPSKKNKLASKKTHVPPPVYPYDIWEIEDYNSGIKLPRFISNNEKKEILETFQSTLKVIFEDIAREQLK